MRAHISCGNTPACAGKGRMGLRAGICTREHPRLRGEGRYHMPVSWATRGTPPLARGRETTAWNGALSGGNTPACAGKGENSHKYSQQT